MFEYLFLMVTISGHAEEWVALIGNKIVASSKTFNQLVTKLKEEDLLEKAVVTHISGNHVVL